MIYFEYSRTAKREAVYKLITAFPISLILGSLISFANVHVTLKVFGIIVLIIVIIVVISYAYENFKSKDKFLCKISDLEFVQSVPTSSSGESFVILLKDIQFIEVYEGFGDGPSDEWYIHTINKKYRITSNYGNPFRKIGEILQALLNLEIKKTNYNN